MSQLEPDRSFLRIGTAVAAFAVVFAVAVVASGSMFAVIEYTYYIGTVGLGTLMLGTALWRLQFGDGWGGRETLLAVGGVGAILVYVYATHIEPYRLRVRELTIPLENVETPVRIVHLSDIQTPTIGAYEERVFREVRSKDPDLVVHTGDILQPPTGGELEKLAELFETLDPPLGVYNVQGDADAGLSREVWRKFDEEAGTETLFDETVRVDREATGLEVLGVGTRKSRELEPERVNRWIASSDPDDERVHLVFGHAPDYMLALRGAGTDVDVALAGHTHGGQIRLPLYGPPVTLSDVPRHWARGLTIVDGIHLNVSAGIGAERSHGIPPIRLNCPPEFSVIDLVSGSSSSRR